MKFARPNVEYKLNDLQGMIYAACQMGAWAYNDQKHLYMSTAPHQKEYEMMLHFGGCLDLALAKKDLEPVPYVLSGELGLHWVAEWVHLRQGGTLLVLLGPVYLKNSSVENSLQIIDRRGISPQTRRDLAQVFGDVPFLHMDTLIHYACIMHFLCYEENLSRESIVFESARKPEKPSEESEVDFQENDFRRMVAYEDMMLRCLVQGRAPEQTSDKYIGELQDFHLKDGVRQTKDNLIIFNALSARSVMRAGVPVLTAKNLESDWVRRIEGLRGIGETPKLTQAMYADYQKLVLSVQEADGLSRAVRECRDYIRRNYTKPLSMEEIARHCGYTEYYLTRKFTKETGMKITDYIRSVRVDAAKVMLLSSQKDIQQISEELQFGSRSYFDRMFRQEVGISPRQYRETMGQGKQEKE
ncbi:MAG: helix-turn-helix transcriptional regulator [Lachnospiraceae bacterium]|nr:helix-turn-helix transcriptional regulator [Lachnospiraceae bacterium]